jgi:hypothetical protein
MAGENIDDNSLIKEGVGKRVFGSNYVNNESLRKMAFRGDVDRNSVFYDLIKTTLSPRSIALKLQLHKTKNDPEIE